MLGALEAGGTKMILATGEADGTIYETARIETADPTSTLEACAAWFAERNIDALGIGAFGPVGVNLASPHFGYILETPKTAWRWFDVLGTLQKSLNIPVAIDTDVNVACLGEVTFGCAKGLSDVVYLTIGTGVGAGVLSGGALIHGALHPEAGHIPITKRADDPLKDSACPYHPSCLEGLIAGPAIAKRWPELSGNVGESAEAMNLLAHYLGQALATYTLCYAPQKIIIGGGIADTTDLVARSRQKLKEALNGYLTIDVLDDIESFVVNNSLDGKQGILGCLALAKEL